MPDEPPPVVPLAYETPPVSRGPDIRAIALRQRALIYCMLAYVLLTVLAFNASDPSARRSFGLMMLVVMIAGAVFVFMLALSLYNPAAGIVLGILALIPLAGLVVLLSINGKATNVLRHHGIRVGLMGARASEIPAPGQIVGPRIVRTGIIRRL